jgi:acetyl esterase/lipase
MTLAVHTLKLTPAQTRAAQRVNAALALAPRLKPDGWRLILGQRLNGVVSQAAGAITEVALKRRGVRLSTVTIPGPGGPLAIRLLEPAGPARALMVDLHGGGWVVGSAALNDRLTGHLAEAGFAVASVDYRLLDEVRGVWLPDAVADCVVALRWALDEGAGRFGVDRVFVIGESAGAHLAALAVLALRDAAAAVLPTGCIFVQGVFDLSGTPSARSAGPDALLFDGPNLERDLGRLTPGRDETARRRADISPLYADLSGMPPALFVLGDKDPFQDDSRLMAARWAEGAPATRLDVPDAPHGFQHFGAPSAVLAQAFIRDWAGAQAGNSPLSVENTDR